MSKKKIPPRPEELALPCVGVDTHAHMDYGAFDQDLDAVLDRARSAGVGWVGNVFLGPENFAANVGIFAARPDVFYLLGVHPHEATSADDAALSRMQDFFRTEPRLKAMGEIGLDYYYADKSPPEIQRKAFREQLALARALDVPVAIHSRDADNDVITTLLDLGFKDRPVLWHCFGKGRDLAATILAQGWHISFPGVLTFPKNEQVREAVAFAPLERMVLETDCPFLSPVPYRGKRNEPSYLAFVAAAAAECKNMDPAELWTRCGETARKFFGLDAAGDIQDNSA